MHLVYPELSYTLTGILFEVHNSLGNYSNEQQYADALEQLCKEKNMAYEREFILPPSFAGEHSGRNRIDFLIEGKVILELKVKRIISREDYYQIQRYLHALNLKLGIIVNFRDRYLKPKRILNSRASS